MFDPNNHEIEAIYSRACTIRGGMIDKGVYTLPELKEDLERSEIEDDGFDSVRTCALRLLIRNAEAGTDPFIA